MKSVQPHTYAVHLGIPTSLLRFVKAVPGFFADLKRSLLCVQPENVEAAARPACLAEQSMCSHESVVQG